MAWSWSHTQQAYANAEENLRNLPKETLEIIFAEWRAAQGKHGIIDPVSPDFNERKYERALKHAKTLPHDTLVDFVWEKASEFATCDNGGFDAWMCPHGCGPHCVSFSRPEEGEIEDIGTTKKSRHPLDDHDGLDETALARHPCRHRRTK